MCCWSKTATITFGLRYEGRPSRVAGMMLGNAISGVSVGLTALLEEFAVGEHLKPVPISSRELPLTDHTLMLSAMHEHP